MKRRNQMGFDFNPTLWFICRLCRRSFDDIDKLKEHKLACHLRECIGIKCIIFEEKFLETDWKPEHNFRENRTETLNTNEDNETSLEECKDRIQPGYSSARDTSFKNPYVTLTRLTEEEINTSLNKFRSYDEREEKFGASRTKQLSKSSCKSESSKRNECELSKQNLKGDRNDEDFESRSLYCYEYDESKPSTSSSMDYMELYVQEDIQIKKESSIYGESNSANFAADESAYTKFEDVENQEFIMSNVSSNSDEIPQVEFESNLISPSSYEYQLYEHQQEQEYQTVSEDSDPFANIAHSDHRQVMSHIGASDSNSNSNSNFANVAVIMNTYDLPLSNNSLPLEAQNPEQYVSEFIQTQESASNVNSQLTGTGESVAKPFLCEICFASFRISAQLNSHMLCHSSLKPFKCPKCPARFKRKGPLTRHQIVHGKETNYKCRFCSKSFSHNQNLVDHERSHIGDRPFKCPVAACGYSSSSKGTLTAHARAKHFEELGLQHYVCPKCGKAYGVRNYLNVHMRIVHGGTKRSVIPTIDVE